MSYFKTPLKTGPHAGHRGPNSQREKVTALKLFAVKLGRGSEINRTSSAAWCSAVVEGSLSYREINHLGGDREVLLDA